VKALIVSCTLLVHSLILAQDSLDTLPYNSYRERVVWYSDLGFSTAPFSIGGDFNNNVRRVRYRHNQRLILGIGVAYKWFGLRLGVGLPVLLRPRSRFGDANYVDLGFKFNIRQTFWDVDFRNYSGYVVRDAYQWNDTLNALDPNAKVRSLRSTSFSINSWYFRSEDFKMNAVLGKTGDYKKSHGTWYFKGTLNLFGIANDAGPMLPKELVDTTKTLYNFTNTASLDFGFIPGYAYVYRWNNWQVTGFGGLGGVVQTKFFSSEGISRGFLGLAPRIDFRVIAGYSKPKYFIWLHTDFDIKSIRFREVGYLQSFNTFRVIAGLRIDRSKKKKR
jgi:hypothetical protein